MPGSPPTRMAEASTRPPPRTRSNSAMPDTVRGGGTSVAARSVSATRAPRAPAQPLGGGTGRQRRLLDDGVPRATGVAAARPLGVGRAAGRAGEGDAVRHQRSSMPRATRPSARRRSVRCATASEARIAKVKSQRPQAVSTPPHAHTLRDDDVERDEEDVRHGKPTRAS